MMSLLIQSGAKNFLLANFDFLGLEFLGLDFLAVKP